MLTRVLGETERVEVTQGCLHLINKQPWFCGPRTLQELHTAFPNC